MSDKNKKSNYYNWSIEKGDYVRDYESTTTFEKKKRRNLIRSRALKIIGFAGFILILLAAIIDLLFKT